MLKVVNNQVISDMDDEDDDDGLLEPALGVDEGVDDSFDLNVPPTTGNEYLRRVRQEAKKCPKVVVARLDTSVYKHKQTVKVQSQDTMPAPRGFSPTVAWVKMQVADFVALRQKIVHFKALLAKKQVTLPNVKLPLSADAESWCRLCFGRLQLKTTGEGGGEGGAEANGGGGGGGSNLQNDGHGTPPLLSIVARMDQPTVIKVLEYHVNWFEVTGFTHKQGQWFYSLLAVLQKPLTPESCSWLRQLARTCSVVRATLKSPEEEVLQEVNLLIALVAHYFDQGDLADPTS